MALLDIRLWEAGHFTPGTQSSKGLCTWGGAPCEQRAEFTVTDRAGVHWAACDKHVVSYIRDRLRPNGAVDHSV